MAVHLAIIMPVFNEVRWVKRAAERVLETTPPPGPDGHPCSRTLFIIDDGSTDGTGPIVEALAQVPGVVTLRHGTNMGKGAAIRTGFARALDSGADIVLVHDADLEYDPRDHARVLEPILDGRADAVIGSRFIGPTHRVLYFWHYVANRFISTLCGMITNLNLSDVECCIKAFTANSLRAMTLTEDRFEIEVEMVAKVAKARLPSEDGGAARRARVYEVAVTYSGRTYEEGKKIRWEDGLRALWAVVRHGFG